ncbi:MAG: ATP synthase F1 subunit gamma [Candidatus Neomarinimicrobiota bacterium]|nr:ATP synthase F1 subunit gamma [Candidatus Neomarinimicrobiota bacterium]
MANLKDIRNRIKSVKSIQQVTKAMKMVAAAKMRRAQENMEQARPYASRLNEMLNSLLPSIDRKVLNELQTRDIIKRKLFVIITADRGMAGAFNTNVNKIAQQSIDEFGKDKSDLICIGKKSTSHFKLRNYNIISEYVDFWSDLNFEDAMEISSAMISRFVNGEVDQVSVIYNEFINVGKQEVRNNDFLPLIHDVKEESKKNIMDRIYEPSKTEVVKTLVPKYLNTQVWQFLLESFASEQAARMLAMENATSNAQDMIKDLTLQFNKARQSAITTEMLEIVSGAEALN